MDLAVPMDHRMKIKENEKADKYLDPARELKHLWNMKVMVIPIVVRTLEMFVKGLEKRLEELEIRKRIETTQTSVLLRSARIQNKVLETWDLLSLRLQ